MMLAIASQVLLFGGTAHAETFYLITTADAIVTFDSAAPGTLSPAVTVTGINGADNLVGIDVRPSNGQLYVLGQAGFSTGRLYKVDPTMGAAIQVGSSFSLNTPGAAMGFDPITGQVRVTSGADQNHRVDPDTGTITTGTNLAYVAGDPNLGNDPGVLGLAHTNNFPGAASTTLFGYDFNDVPNHLARVGGPDGSPSPDLGQLTTIANTSVTTGIGTNLGLDIAPDGTAYAMLRIGTTSLYRLDVASGIATNLGQIGDATDTKVDIAAFPVRNTIQFDASSYKVNEDAGTATITLTRSNAIGTASVNYATANGSAQAPADYTASSGTATFPAGQTSTSFSVPIADDTKTSEKDETVNLSLSAPSGGIASLGNPSTAVLTIANSPAPTLSGVSLTNGVFSVGRQATKKVDLSARRPRGVDATRKAKIGTTFRYKLSETATVTIVIERGKGRKAKKVGSLRRAAKKGRNKVKFSGRIGRKLLRPGSYRASLTAKDKAGNRSRRRMVRFGVVPG